MITLGKLSEEDFLHEIDCKSAIVKKLQRILTW